MANFVQIVANQRGATASDVIGRAVTALTESARGGSAARTHVIRSTQSYTHQLPDRLRTDNQDGADGRATGRPGPVPQYTQRVNAYVPRQTLDELDELCADAKMSRARMIRLAVDQALFEEMRAAGLNTSKENRTGMHVTGV